MARLNEQAAKPMDRFGRVGIVSGDCFLEPLFRFLRLIAAIVAATGSDDRVIGVGRLRGASGELCIDGCGVGKLVELRQAVSLSRKRVIDPAEAGRRGELPKQSLRSRNV